jgi:predicted TIM-barrel fold metal-dependent hydrolase
VNHALDVAGLTAIDVHVHAEVSSTGQPDRWLADFANLPIKPEVREKILKQNAARLLGLAGG